MSCKHRQKPVVLLRLWFSGLTRLSRRFSIITDVVERLEGNLLSAHALGLQADFLLVVISARLLSVSPSGSRRNIIQTLSKVFVCETIDDGFATAVARLGKDPSSVYSH